MQEADISLFWSLGQNGGKASCSSPRAISTAPINPQTPPTKIIISGNSALFTATFSTIDLAVRETTLMQAGTNYSNKNPSTQADSNSNKDTTMLPQKLRSFFGNFV